jgi:hypothetical protein
MKFNPSQDERKHLRQIVKQNQMWVKNTKEGPMSLMRALSNAIHFTEARFNEIQCLIIRHFLQSLPKADFKNLKSKKPEVIQRFLSSPGLPEFESLNLEIVSLVYKTRFKLFYVNKDTLCSEQFYKKTSKSYGVFRFCSGFYAAVFSKEFKLTASMAQNFVLSLTDSALDGLPLTIKNKNKGRLINFEYEQDINGQSTTSKAYDFSFNNTVMSDSNLSYSFQLSQSNSTSSSSDKFGGENITQLILEHRKGKNFENENSEEPGPFIVLGEKEKSNESKKSQVCSFVNKIALENDNLNREVSDMKMKKLFGFLKSHSSESNKNINPDFERTKNEGNESCFFEKDNSIIKNDEKSISNSKNFRPLSQSKWSSEKKLDEPLRPTEKSRDLLSSRHELQIDDLNQRFSHSVDLSLVDQSRNLNEKSLYLNDKSSNRALNEKILPNFEDDGFHLKINEASSLLSEGKLSFYDSKKGFGIILVKKPVNDKISSVYVFRNDLVASGINVEQLESRLKETQIELRFEIDSVKHTRKHSFLAKNISFISS